MTKDVQTSCVTGYYCRAKTKTGLTLYAGTIDGGMTDNNRYPAWTTYDGNYRILYETPDEALQAAGRLTPYGPSWDLKPESIRVYFYNKQTVITTDLEDQEFKN